MTSRLGDLPMRSIPAEKMRANLGAEQVAWFRRVLAEHQNVRWTFISMHRPGWRPQSPGFSTLIQSMAGRTAALPRCAGEKGANQILKVHFVNGAPVVSVEVITEDRIKQPSS